MNFKPSYDYVLIEPLPAIEAITRGGIIVPTPDGAAKGELTKGKVLRTGDGVPVYTGALVPCIHKIGDVVSYTKEAYGFIQIFIGGEECHLVKDQAILGIYVPED